MEQLANEHIELTAADFFAILKGGESGNENFGKFYRPQGFSKDAIVFENILINEPLDFFSKIEVNHDVFFISGDFLSEVKFKNCTFNKEVRIEGGTFHKMSGIEDCTFLQGFTIAGGTFRNDFCVFDGTYNRLVIEGGTFESNFNVFGGLFNAEFMVYEGTFLKNFKVESGTFNSTFSVHGGNFQHFIIENGDFKKSVWIEGGNYNKQFSLLGGSFDRVFIRSSSPLHIENLEFSFKQNPVKLVKLTNVDDNFTINSLEFTETILTKDALVQLEGIKVRSLTFTSTHNYGNISFSKVLPFVGTEGCHLSIINSDMGKTTLIDSDLSNFLLHFQSSKITELFIIGTMLADEISPTAEQLANKRIMREQQRLGYGQLKKIYDSRGDVVTANQYFAREMNAYYKTLSWKTHGWEKANLGMNRLSTNHGQSWKRGLATTLLISVAAYWAYCFSIGYTPATPTEKSMNIFWKLASYFFEYINPIHKADYIADQLHATVNNAARIIEAFSRIFTGYLIYQFIQAFRKHGKK